jgi:hypothetical protein
MGARQAFQQKRGKDIGAARCASFCLPSSDRCSGDPGAKRQGTGSFIERGEGNQLRPTLA